MVMLATMTENEEKKSKDRNLKRPLTVRLTDDSHELLERICEHTRRPKNSAIDYALRKYAADLGLIDEAPGE